MKFSYQKMEVSTSSNKGPVQLCSGCIECTKCTKYTSEEKLITPLYGYYGEFLREYSPADISKMRFELKQAEMFRSEVNTDNIMDFFNAASDKVMTAGSSFTSQLKHLNNMIDLLGDPALGDSLNFDVRKLADMTSQLLIALKLLSNEPTMTNMVLVFTSCLTKLNLSPDKMRKYINFIKDSIATCVAAIRSIGFKSENAFSTIVDTMKTFCGDISDKINDQVIDIVLTFLAKCVAFWTTMSGGFLEELLDISSIPKLVTKIRDIISQGGDLLEGIFGGFTWMMDNFPKFYKGDFSGLWFGKEETKVFEARVSKCKKAYPLICAGSWDIVKEEFGWTEHSYTLEVHNLIKTAQNMMKGAKPSQMPGLKKCLDELREVHTDQLMKSAQIQAKMTAIGICYVGKSGVGKSLLMEQTSKCLISAAGEIPTNDKIVTGQMSDKFDSNELPQHLSIQYDDVGNNSSNENFDKLLNAVNSQSRPFLKAGVDEKGRMFPANVACVISTNVPGLNAQKSNCPDSIGRRFLHIETSIKESVVSEVCLPGTKRVDSTKATTPEGEPRMDIWEFNVYEFITFDIPEELPEGCIVWQDMVVRKLHWTDKSLEDQTYWDLARFLTFRAKKHFSIQEKALTAMKNRQNVDYCKDCHLPESVCLCVGETQSEWFGTDVIDVSLHSLASAYDNMCITFDNLSDAAQWRAGLLALTFIAPPQIRRKITYIGIPSFSLMAAYTNNVSFSILCSLLCMCGIYMLQIFVVVRRLRSRLANTYGLISQLAADTAEVVRQQRNNIFAGASMVTFMYLVYRAFRPKSEMMSYQESLPDNLRSAFARAEKAKTTPRDNIIPHVKKDMGVLTVTSNGKRAQQLAFPIEANFYITAAHILPEKGDFTIEIFHENTITPTVAKQKLSACHVYRFKGKDLALFQVPSAIPRRGYKDFLLANPSVLGRQGITMFTMDLETFARRDQTTFSEPAFSFMRSSITTDKTTIVKPYKYASAMGTRGGMCGSVIMDYSQAIIYGFHVAGDGRVGLYSHISIKEVNEALATFKGFVPLNRGDLQLGSQTLTRDPGMCAVVVNDPEHDKPIDQHNCVVEGVLPEKGATFKSPYIKHPFIEKVTEEFGPYKFGPPKEINSDFHKRKALTKLTTPNQEFSLDEMDFVVKDYMSPILKNIKSMDIKERDEYARVLTVQEALDGIGEPSLSGINNSTSVGYPFKGKKMNFLERDPIDPCIPLTPRELVNYNGINIIEEMDEMKKRYLSGISCRPLFKCSMKTNELLPVEKKKARIFMGSNFPFLLLCRQYLAPLIRFMSRNKFMFESAKGMNMDSVEAEQMYHYLKVEQGTRVVALDHTAYDQTMSAQATNAVAGMILDILYSLGCDADHLLITRGLLTDIIYPNLHFFGTILQLANSDPSGNPITTELNGMVNSLYLRVFFFRIYPEHKGKVAYRDAIRTMTFGDDNVNSVFERFCEFNGINIVEEGKKVGLKITMADKDAEITRFTTIENSDFLKRKFRFCPDLGRVRAPLTKSSITKSLYWMKKDSPDKPEILFAQNVDNALRKSSQHGREYFEEVRQKLLNIATEHDVIHLCKWWTYDELIEHDLKNYYEEHVCHHVHPNIFGNDQEVRKFVSELRKKPKMSILERLISVIFMICYGTILFHSFNNIAQIETTVLPLLKKYTKMSKSEFQRMSDEVQSVYTMSGWQGVIEMLGFPVWILNYIKKFLPKSTGDDDNSFGEGFDLTSIDSQGDFVSESFTLDVFKSQYFEDDKPNYRRKTILTLLYEIMEFIMSLRPFALTGRLSEIGMSPAFYLSSLFAMFSFRTAMGMQKDDGPITTGLSIVTREVRRIFMDLYLRQSNEFVRKQAFGFFIEGLPGCGKTFAALMIVRRLRPETQKHELVVLNEEDAFQSELRSHHKVIILDDVGNTIETHEEGNPLRRPLDFINNTPRRALNPEAELKGNIKVDPDIVFLTSNWMCDQLVQTYSVCPESLYRRWVRIELIKNGPFVGPMDLSKWTFRVHALKDYVHGSKVHMTKAYKSGSGRHSYRDYDTDEFLDFIENLYHIHMVKQESLVKAVDKFFEHPTYYQRLKGYIMNLRSPRFKSEGLRDDEVVARLCAIEDRLDIDNFVRELRDIASTVDAEMHFVENPPVYPWHISVLKWLGFEVGFRSESETNADGPRHADISTLSAKQREILWTCRHDLGSGGVILTNDFILFRSGGFYPITTKGVMMYEKFYDQMCRMPSMMLSLETYYDYEQISKLIRAAGEWYRSRDLLDEEVHDGVLPDIPFEITFRSESRELDERVVGPLDEYNDNINHGAIVAAYVKLFGADHIAQFLMNHVDELTRTRIQQMLVVDELDQTGEIDDMSDPLVSDDDRVIDSIGEPAHPAFKTMDGFSDLDWSGIYLGKCPSIEEAIAQEMGHVAFLKIYPEAQLVAREIAINSCSIDLIYRVDDEFIVLECKANRPSVCKKQSQKKACALRCLGKNVSKAYSYASDVLCRTL